MRSWLKPLLIGFCGTLAALLLAGVILMQWTLWVRASNGEAAFEFLQKQVQQQQAPKPPDKK